MIQLADMSNFVVGLEGIVSEPSRTLVARRLANILGQSFVGTPVQEAWETHGCQRFLSDCKLNCPERWVDDRLNVSETKLAAFCNKWMQVSHFKLADSEAYTTITPELNGLRFTMIEELKSLST